jgi:hypothetical protein
MSFGNLRRVHHAMPSCPSSSILTINAHSTTQTSLYSSKRRSSFLLLLLCELPRRTQRREEEVEFNVGVQSINLHDKKIFPQLLIHSPPLSDFLHRRFPYR